MCNKPKYRLLELMKTNSINAMEMATKCQVHIQTVYHWSKIPYDSHLSMPADAMKKVADIFNVSMEDIYTKSDLITA
jgi:DNA-binding XRE family transcriptional regulator